MAKPIIQVKIEGPQGSGKTILAQSIASVLRRNGNYRVTSPASSYDNEESLHVEDDFHIIQIRTRQTGKEASDV